MHQRKWIIKGEKLARDSKVLILLHGRGADATDILSLGAQLQVSDFTLIAPEATGNTWYPYSFMAPANQNEPWLSSAVELIDARMVELKSQGVDDKRICFLGFSQGACLALEYTTRNAKRFGGVIAFTGGLIGQELDHHLYRGDFDQTPIFIGSSDPDPHVPVSRVEESVRIIKGLNASLNTRIYPGLGHTINADEMMHANQILAGIS